jgi:hypothetical protein
MAGRIWRVVWLWIHLVVLAGYSSAAGGRTDLKSNLTCEFQTWILSYSSAADGRTDLKSSLTLWVSCLLFFSYSSDTLQPRMAGRIWRVIWLVNSRLEFSDTLQPRMAGQIWRVVWLVNSLYLLLFSDGQQDEWQDGSFEEQYNSWVLVSLPLLSYSLAEE